MIHVRMLFAATFFLTCIVNGLQAELKQVTGELDHLSVTDSSSGEESDVITLKIDASENCLFLNEAVEPSEKVVRHRLQPNRRYSIEVSGEAFFSSHKGRLADPMPGLIVFYCTNEQDGFSSEYRVLRSGDSLSFVTPNRNGKYQFLTAFFIDYWPASANRGGYELKIRNEAPKKESNKIEQVAGSKLININFANPVDDVDPQAAIKNPGAHWNFVDYSQTELTGIRSADGAVTDIAMEISPNDGEWGIPGETGVYHGYIYHNCRCVDLEVKLFDVPAGIYEVYVFAHGDAPNQNAAIEIESNGTKLSGQSTLNDGTWRFKESQLQEGNQYVKYLVEVVTDQPLKITSKRDGSDYSMFNALQLRKLD